MRRILRQQLFKLGDAFRGAFDVVAQAHHAGAEFFHVVRAHQHRLFLDQELGQVFRQAAPGGAGVRYRAARAAGQAHGADRAEQALEVVFRFPAQALAQLRDRVREFRITLDAHIRKGALAILGNQRQVGQLDVDGNAGHGVRLPCFEQSVGGHAQAHLQVAGIDAGQLAVVAAQRRARPVFPGQQMVDRGAGRRAQGALRGQKS